MSLNRTALWLSVFANIGFEETQAKLNTSQEVQLFNLIKGEDEVSLITVLENIPSYFSIDDELPFPDTFEFPRSFEYTAAFAKVTVGDKKKKKIFEGTQSAIFDEESNRVRLERETRIFHEKDREVKLFDFNKMRLLVSDPSRKMCMKLKIADNSPVSMIPRDNDHIVIMDAIQNLWIAPQTLNQENVTDEYDLFQTGKLEAKTQYLGEHKIAVRSTLNTLINEETFHIFTNSYAFLEMEENYAKKGGSGGAQTMYLWRELIPTSDENEESTNQQASWQLAGFATRYRSNQPNVFANLGTTFHTLDPQTIDTNDFQLRFYQQECQEYLDEYMLIDGKQLVKKVGVNLLQ